MNLELGLRAAKLDHQQIGIFDKEVFHAQLQHKLSQEQVKQRRPKKRWITVLSPLLLIPIAGVVYASISTDAYRQLTVEEGLRHLKFNVKQPTTFPFPVTSSWADLESIDSSKDIAITIIYESENHKSIIEQVTTTGSNEQFHIIPSPRDAESVRLGDGRTATYSSKLGELVWQQDGNTYLLQDEQVIHHQLFLSLSELVAVANSIK